MATTSYTESTFSVSAIGARTDASGAAVTDFTAEEVRLGHFMLSEGWLHREDSFKVQAQASPNMTVKVGTGDAQNDHYVVWGPDIGQGNYIVRLNTTGVNVTIAASDPGQTRVDEIYLVIQDNAYDGSGRALPRIGYRRGDVGGGNPGADSSWTSFSRLARVTVAAGATTITSANIADTRTEACSIVRPAPAYGLLWQPLYETRTSDVSCPSTAWQQAFVMPVLAAGRYLVEGFLHYAAAPNTHMHMGWTGPSGSSGRWSSGGIQINSASRIGNYDMGMVDLNVDLPVSGDSGGPTVEVAARPVLHLTATQDGSLVFFVAQYNDSGFVTTLRAGSTMRITRVL